VDGSNGKPKGVGTATDALVIFGITGDLARKMTFRALYRLQARGKLDCPVIGVGRRDDWNHHTMRQTARDSITESLGSVDEEVFDALAARMRFVSGNFDNQGTYTKLSEELAESEHPLFYLEVPPSLFGPVIHHLNRADLTEKGRFVLEKPFGHDLDSAIGLQEDLTEFLDEDQILRIDHYLGKEPVMDITYLRFANSILEPVWNRNYVSYVQLTLAENFGVDDRGAFYDKVGTIRDVIQNHALQVLSLVAMEAPSANQTASIRAKKIELFESIRSADPARCVRGQYEGYREVKGVEPDSNTETYAALELEIDNWRWSGVPFFLRAGKCMPYKQTEVRVVFKRPPHLAVGRGNKPGHNEMIVRIDPLPGARMRFIAKKPGDDDFEDADLDVLFEKEPGVEPEPYERLLDDAIHGRMDLFTPMDAVEETWRIVQPLLDDPGEVIPYEPGTWGPVEADRLVKGVCAWNEPWRPVEKPDERRVLGG
jgi:glucose-6-phosphate 1-dehydrogenase